uniref:RRM domain-containing protein n=1 Tax=viral metagenome TaxID=1070528 RepID=A0A6C0KDX5_9ZZZZ
MNKVLCIPRVLSTVKNYEIQHVFHKLNIGNINYISFIPNKDKHTYKVFVYLSKWFDNEKALMIKTKLNNGETLFIVYDYPWFWKISLNKFEKTM